MTNQDACAVEPAQVNQEFEDLAAAWAQNGHWLRFFVRPCCPAPSGDSARNMIEKLKAEVDASGFTEEQKAHLKAIADERIEWYLHLGVRKGK